MRNLCNKTLKHKILVLLALLLFAGATVGCIDFNPQNTAEPTLSFWDYQIDPIFRRFYTYYGGVDVFGPAISDALPEGDTIVQYTEAVKMIYDPQAPLAQRFRLAPLGASLVVSEPEVSRPEEDVSAIYIDGHIIHPIFAETYKKLADILGKPLTEARMNVQEQRVEQLFENMGLSYDTVNEEMEYLAYGVAMCDSRCRNKPDPDTAVPFRLFPIDPTFASTVTRVGVDFTGYPITPGYYTADDRWQQIFENMVMSAQSPNDFNTIVIEPISRKVPFVSDAPRAYSGDPAVQFIATQGELGYEIPLYFWQYLQLHGGLDISGAPISQARQMDDRTQVQCFTNLCVEYNRDAVESRRVRPVGLGYFYKTMFGPVQPDFPTPASPPTSTPELRTVTLEVWAALQTLDTRLQQEIGVLATLNQKPLPGVQPTLTLYLPDGREEMHVFPPTGADGQSVLHLPLIEGRNGDVVIYVVCVIGLSNERFCIKNNFIIWNNP